MEKRSINDRNRERVEGTRRSKPSKAEKPEVKLESKPKTVRLVLLKNVKLRIVGSVTGKEYFFANGSGTILPVDERDAPTLLKRGIGEESCCSGIPTSPYFERLD